MDQDPKSAFFSILNKTIKHFYDQKQYLPESVD